MIEDDEEFDEEEEEEEEGEREEEQPEAAKIFCPVCGSEFVRLIEKRNNTDFYECEACHLAFEEDEL